MAPKEAFTIALIILRLFDRKLKAHFFILSSVLELYIWKKMEILEWIAN